MAINYAANTLVGVPLDDAIGTLDMVNREIYFFYFCNIFHTVNYLFTLCIHFNTIVI